MEFIQKTNEENEAVSAIINVSRGKTYRAEDLDGILVYKEKKIIGLGLYYIKNNECEIVLMETFIQNKGIGTQLIQKIKEIAEKEKCKRIWLITTNENINAIRFYQKRGFHLSNIYINALEESRKIIPEIPKMEDGIEIRDEIEFEMIL